MIHFQGVRESTSSSAPSSVYKLVST